MCGVLPCTSCIICFADDIEVNFMEKKYYTVRDIKDIFGCGQSKAYKMLKEGIPHIRIGRNIYIPIKEFEKWQKDKINP